VRTAGRGRSVRRGHGSLVRDELDYDVARLYQRDTIGVAVLDASRGAGESENTATLAQRREDSAQRDRSVRRPVASIIKNEAPASQVYTCRTFELDALVGVGTAVVIMQLGDERLTSLFGRSCRNFDCNGVCLAAAGSAPAQ
jgi:hypothetical protein